MKQGTTFVGIDAHKKDLVVAMFTGSATTPVTWQVANEPTAVRRPVRKLENLAPGGYKARVIDSSFSIRPRFSGVGKKKLSAIPWRAHSAGTRVEGSFLEPQVLHVPDDVGAIGAAEPAKAPGGHHVFDTRVEERHR